MASVSRAGTGRSSQFNEIFAADRIVDQSGAGTDTTIADAITNLPANGGTIYLREATYNITSTLTIPAGKDVVIRGGGKKCTINIGSNVIAAIGIVDTITNLTISDVNFTAGSLTGQSLIRKTAATTTGSGSTTLVRVTAEATGALFEKIFDCGTYGIIPTIKCQECRLPAMTGGYLMDSTTTNLQFAASGSYLSGGVITGGSAPSISLFDGCTWAASGTVTLANCVFDSSFIAPATGTTIEFLSKTRISNCLFNGGGASTHYIKFGTGSDRSIVTGSTFGTDYTYTRAIDVGAVTGISVMGCTFGGGVAFTSETLRTAGTGGTYCGNINFKVTETGAANQNIYDGNQGFTGSTIIGVSSVVELENFRNVRTWGAVGDGSTNDQAAIQAAFNALPTTGGTVYFPPGNYLVTTTITVPDKSVLVKGAGKFNTRIFTTTALVSVFSGASSNTHAFESLTINGNDSSGQAVYTRTGGSSDQSIYFRDVDIGTGGQIAKFLVCSSGTQTLFAENCTWRPKTDGYLLSGGIAATLVNFNQASSTQAVLVETGTCSLNATYCTFYLSNAAANILSGGAKLEGCYFSGGALPGVALRITGLYGSNSTFYFIYTELNGLSVVSDCFFSATTGVVVWVNTPTSRSSFTGCSFFGMTTSASLPLLINDSYVRFQGCMIYSNAGSGADRLVDITVNGSYVTFAGCDFTGHSASGECIRTAANFGVFSGNGGAQGIKVLESGSADYNQYWSNRVFYGTLLGANSRVDGVAMGTSLNTAEGIGKANLNLIAVGNVGTGEDDLITYSLPSYSLYKTNSAVKIKAWGTTANNANAKTLKAYFGTQLILTYSLTTSQAGLWEVNAIVGKTGSNTQEYHSKLEEAPNDQVHQENGTGAVSDTAAITIKCTGEATSSNDIVQEGMLVEIMN